MSRTFTVIGFWDRDDRRHVVGVVEGNLAVLSGVDVTEGGLFAEVVPDAVDADSACGMIHGTSDDESECVTDEEGECSCNDNEEGNDD